MREGSPQQRTSLDTVFDVLANDYRRRLLVALLEHNPRDDADTQVPDDVEAGGDDLDSLRIRMIHAHLPKLEAEGFIEWDQETNTVRRGLRFAEIRPLLELMCDRADELPDDWL